MKFSEEMFGIDGTLPDTGARAAPLRSRCGAAGDREGFRRDDPARPSAPGVYARLFSRIFSEARTQAAVPIAPMRKIYRRFGVPEPQTFSIS